MAEQLADKRALVVGAAGGIGSAVVRVLAGQGARVVAADIVAPNAPDAELTLVCDATSDESWQATLAHAEDALGGLDAFAYITGTLHPASPVETFPMDEWDRVFEVNVKGLVRASRVVVPAMRRQGGGSIAAITSWYGHSGHAFFGAYCASKAALINLTQTMADELAADHIRVNSVAPGNIDTSMHRNALETEARNRGISFEEMRDIEWAKIPLKIAGPPESIAEGVAFLLSDASSYTTGATLDVNGGCMYR